MVLFTYNVAEDESGTNVMSLEVPGILSPPNRDLLHRYSRDQLQVRGFLFLLLQGT